MGDDGTTTATVTALPVGRTPHHSESLDVPVMSGRRWSGDRPVKLSMVMPAYNEGRTIAEAVTSVLATSYPCDFELIVVDDGSRDDTRAILETLDDDRLVVVSHPRNFGKGAALLTGAAMATGTHFLPFDADLEYSPADVAAMVGPVIAGRCDVVYGTRLFGQNTVYQSYHYALGNKMTTLAANVLFNSYLSDLHTCLKLVPLRLLRDLPLTEMGFGLDTEITASLLALGVRPFEVPVSYHSRSHDAGKKLTWRDGVQCLQVLGRVRMARGTKTKNDANARSSTPIRQTPGSQTPRRAQERVHTA